MKILNYIGRLHERIFKRHRRVSSKRNWYNVPGSIFGFDYFLSPNPMTKEDKENFTKSLGNVITSNFEVIYNSMGMVLIPKKRNLETLAAA